MSVKLGQVFLKNKYYLKKIARELKIEEGEVILEIGGGHGELTEFLLKFSTYKNRVISIEKDKFLAKLLQEKFKNYKNFKVEEGDVLKILPQIKEKKLKIVGNIPYYITGKILRTISEMEIKPKKIIFLFQKEVAQKIISKPPKMNLPAAITQYWSNPILLNVISRKNFSPVPKVDSAILVLNPKKIKDKKEAENYFRFVKILFKQPRKTVFNNLKEEFKEKIKTMENLKKIRPQNLSVKEIKNLIQILYNFNNEA